MITVTNNPGD